MNASTGLRNPLRSLIAVGLVGGLLAGCAPTPVVPEGAVQAREALARLQADSKLAPLAQEALRDAEAAVQLAEQTDAKPEIAAHRVYIAQRKVDIAEALAQARYSEQERTALAAELDRARLQAREREADSARMEADTARMEAQSAEQKAADLQRSIDELRARPTDRGLVLTLGDVLFDTGRADLKSGAIADLDRLGDFLNKYPDRTVSVEGHTDSVGSSDYNLGLSQRRAESVRSYLVRRGIDASRVKTQGMGKSVPVASNDTAGGRQQNRRVEIVVSNPPQSAGSM